MKVRIFHDVVSLTYSRIVNNAEWRRICPPYDNSVDPLLDGEEMPNVCFICGELIEPDELADVQY